MASIYLSICGDSAVGKTLLIRNLLNDETVLRSRFGISCPEIEAYGPMFCGREYRRNEEWKTLIHRSRADVILYQWQFKHHDIIGELHKQHPDGSHRIVLIWRPWEQHWENYKIKHSEAAKRQSIDTLKSNWRDRLIPQMEELRLHLGIPIELVNGATPDYAPIPEWPEGRP